MFVCWFLSCFESKVDSGVTFTRETELLEYGVTLDGVSEFELGVTPDYEFDGVTDYEFDYERLCP